MKNLKTRLKNHIVIKDNEECHALCLALEFMPLNRFREDIGQDIKLMRKRFRSLECREDGTLRTKFSKTFTENVEGALVDFHFLANKFLREDLAQALENILEEK